MSFQGSQEEQFRQLELERIRALSNGYVHGGIPTSLEHAQRIGYAFPNSAATNTPKGGHNGPLERSHTIQPEYSTSTYPDPMHGRASAPPQTSSIPSSTQSDNLDKLIRTVVLLSHNKQFELSTKYDCGSDDNWMSERAANKMKLSWEPDPDDTWTTIDGQTVTSIGNVQAKWYRRKTKSTQWLKFHVGKNCPYPVTFGRKLILEEHLMEVTDADENLKPAMLLSKDNPKPSKEELQIMKQKKREADAESERIARHQRLLDEGYKWDPHWQRYYFINKNEQPEWLPQQS